MSQTLRHHIIEMFEGRIDEAYIEKRRRVGMMHVKINLYPKWYLAAFHNTENIFRKIVLEEYDHYSEELLEQQRETIKLHVKEVIGGISSQLEGQSHNTNEAVSELMTSAKQVGNYLSESFNKVKTMR